MKVIYLYPRPRNKLLGDYLKGLAPDEFLYGLNRMKKFSIDAEFTDAGHEGILRTALRPIEIATLFNVAPILKVLSKLKNYDIIFSTADGSGLFLSLLGAISKFRLPHIYQTIGLSTRRLVKSAPWLTVLGKRFYRFALSSPRKIICLTPSEKKTLSDIGVPKEKIEYIPFGADKDFFRPAPPTNDGPILSVGRDIFRDYGTLIKAAEGLGTKVRIICSKHNLKGLHIPRQTDVLYDVPYVQLREQYAAARFVVVPTKSTDYAAGQTVLLEAMAMGKAVIASKSEGLYSSLELKNYKHCIFVEPQNIEDFKNAMRYLLDNPGEADKIGKNARKIVEDNYNTENYASRLAKIFRDVVEVMD